MRLWHNRRINLETIDMKNSKRGFISAFVVVGIIIVAAIAGIGSYAVKKHKNTSYVPAQSTPPVVVINNFGTTKTGAQKLEETNVDTSGWKTFRNDEYGFEFKYPSLAHAPYVVKDRGMSVNNTKCDAFVEFYAEDEFEALVGDNDISSLFQMCVVKNIIISETNKIQDFEDFLLVDRPGTRLHEKWRTYLSGNILAYYIYPSRDLYILLKSNKVLKFSGEFRRLNPEETLGGIQKTFKTF